MSLRKEENLNLKKIIDWHLHNAAECRTADEVAERDFHTWAAMVLSLVRETR